MIEKCVQDTNDNDRTSYARLDDDTTATSYFDFFFVFTLTSEEKDTKWNELFILYPSAERYAKSL